MSNQQNPDLWKVPDFRQLRGRGVNEVQLQIREFSRLLPRPIGTRTFQEYWREKRALVLLELYKRMVPATRSNRFFQEQHLSEFETFLQDEMRREKGKKDRHFSFTNELRIQERIRRRNQELMVKRRENKEQGDERSEADRKRDERRVNRERK